jgi:membrane-bound lytic murein transglycosylase B
MFFILILFFIFSLNYSFADDKFKSFLNNFLNEKVSNKYDKTILNDLKKNSYFIKRVVELDRSQPEFTLSLNKYLNKAVSANRIKKGKKLYKENYSLLKKIEKYYKVQPRFIVALWGIETDFGRYTGSFKVIPSLLTLIYDGRRAKYFEKEFFYALDIIKDGHVQMNAMYGKTKSDVFASAANYLKNTGWNYNQTWGRKVYLGKLSKKIDENKKYKLSYLKKINLLNFNKKPLPNSNIYARIIFLKNEKDFGYLAYQNFDNILKWNRSNYFAIAVGSLSDHILYGK